MSGPNNPDFSLDAKRQIAKAVGRVLATPDNFEDVQEPAYPRGGGGLATPQEEYTVYQGVGNNQAGFSMLRGHPPLSGADADDEVTP